MAYLMLILLALAGSSLAAPADTTTATTGGVGDCAGGYKNGDAIERGYFFYICQSGQIVPKGCLADGQRRLAVGETIDRKNYRLKCVIDNAQGLALNPVSCLQLNQEHTIGQDWQDEHNYYTCRSEGTELQIVTLGCVQNGKRVAVGESGADKDIVYVCNKTANNGSKLTKGGCSSGGKNYNYGETVVVDAFYYNCTYYGLKALGCIFQGKQIKSDDSVHDNGVVRTCVIVNDQKELQPTGCSDTTASGEKVERKIGCYFVHGDNPQSFESRCTQDQSSKEVKVVNVRCYYYLSGSYLGIEPGCFQVYDKQLIGCAQDASGQLTYKILPADQVSQATSAGLKDCYSTAGH